MNIKNCMFIRGLYMLWRTYLGIRRSQFGHCDNSVRLTPPLILHNPRNIFLYEDTGIASNSLISTLNARFIMKEHAGAAEGLVVRTGNHMIVLGKNHHEITDEYKKNSGMMAEFDKDVIVEEDAWIGSNVTLLAGVTIGRGATIGAGSIVSRSVPPYSIAAGVPCKVIKFRWTIDEILEHEKQLYPAEKRLSREELQAYFNKYQNVKN